MSSVILDFFHSDGGKRPPKYILRLRGIDNNVIDLAGNTMESDQINLQTISPIGGGGIKL